MMKITIVTPSFNQGRFLADCVISVMTQVGVEFEHIVVDAGSTDETLDVLNRYPHLKWTSEPDRGMSDAINKGFLRATGDWVMWLNCDDYLLPGALARVAAYIHEHPDVDVIHGDCIFVREDKSVIRRKRDHPVDEAVLLFVGCYIPSTSTFIRRSIIGEGNLIDVYYKVCMDWEFYLRLLRKGYKFGYLPEALAAFRWHGTNTSLIHERKARDEMRKLQREHIAARKLPTLLGYGLVLWMLRRVFQAKRVFCRYKAHGHIY